MSKRVNEAEDTSRPPKRARPEQNQPSKPAEEIWSSRQLQDLLAFRQDGLQELRHGVTSLKVFLDNGAFKDPEAEEEIVEEIKQGDDGEEIVVTKKQKMDPMSTVRKAISHEAYSMLKVVD